LLNLNLYVPGYYSPVALQHILLRLPEPAFCLTDNDKLPVHIASLNSASTLGNAQFDFDFI